MKKHLLYPTLLMGLFLASCNESVEKKTETTETKTETTEAKPAKKPTVLDSAYASYTRLGSWLYDGNASQAQAQAKTLVTALSEMESKTDDSVNAMRPLAEAIAGTGDLKLQRIKFAELSELMRAAVKKTGVGHNVYLQYCPMAKTAKGEGAFWLSDKEEILNPYFGAHDEMAACGETKEEM